MISLNASEGNHMHANGISMELYGKGYVLGPDAGIGLYLYSGLDYAEYYSQFPSHNTVCVDGISSYSGDEEQSFLRICCPVFRHLPQLRRQRINSLPLRTAMFISVNRKAVQTRHA